MLFGSQRVKDLENEVIFWQKAAEDAIQSSRLSREMLCEITAILTDLCDPDTVDNDVRLKNLLKERLMPYLRKEIDSHLARSILNENSIRKLEKISE